MAELRYLALEIGNMDVAADAKAEGQEFAANLARSIRMTTESWARASCMARPI